MTIRGNLAQTHDINSARRSFSAKMRIRRFVLLNKLISKIIEREGFCAILDVGGSEYYWELNTSFIRDNSDKVSITIANIDEKEFKNKSRNGFFYKSGDATDSVLYEGNYNFIHSNSVIEHVGDWSRMRAMASSIIMREIPYYVQTPNYWFPVEPHFRTIGFQWLPLDVRAKMLLKKKRGFHDETSYDGAMQAVESVNMLTISQMRLLFSNADILRERVGPFTKSMMAIGAIRR